MLLLLSLLREPSWRRTSTCGCVLCLRQPGSQRLAPVCSAQQHALSLPVGHRPALALHSRPLPQTPATAPSSPPTPSTWWALPSTPPAPRMCRAGGGSAGWWAPRTSSAPRARCQTSATPTPRRHQARPTRRRARRRLPRPVRPTVCLLLISGAACWHTAMHHSAHAVSLQRIAC